MEPSHLNNNKYSKYKKVQALTHNSTNAFTNYPSSPIRRKQNSTHHRRLLHRHQYSQHPSRMGHLATH